MLKVTIVQRPDEASRLTTDNVMTASEVSALLHVAPRTIYRWARTGRIPSVALGRRVVFLRGDVEEWVMRHRRGLDHA